MRDAVALSQAITSLITRPSVRSSQVQIGPSNMGDPCERCLGMAMAGILPDGPKQAFDHFNLMAWVGTAVHYYLEHIIAAERWPKVKQEFKVDIGKVGSYGRVSGSTDLYSEPHRTALDFKMRGKDKIRLWRSGTPIPVESVRQAHLYGYGLQRAGLPVEEICLYIIPRDSMLASDLYQHIEPYSEKIAKDTIKRAARLWKDYVSVGKVELLSSHKDCYNCNAHGRAIQFKESDG
jgi:hypothetical protein